MTNRSLASTTIENKFLFLIFFTFVLITVNSTSDCDWHPQPDSSPSRLARSRNLDEQSDLEISPGATKALDIFLKGQTEEISIDFKMQENDNTVYEITVTNNQQVQLVQVSKFAERETLKIVVNYDSKICNILGNNKFTLTIPVKDSAYEIKVENNKDLNRIVADEIETDAIDTSNDSTTVTNIIAFVLVAIVCTLCLLAIKMILTARKRGNFLSENSLETEPVDYTTNRRGDHEAAITSKMNLNLNQSNALPSITNLENPTKKSEEAQAESAEKIDYEDGISRKLDFNQVKAKNIKSADPNTLVSTAQTLSVLPSQKLNAPCTFGNIKSINEEGVFTNSNMDTSKTDSSTSYKDHQVNSFTLDNIQLRLATNPAANMSVEELPGVSPMGAKTYAFPHKKHMDIGMDLVLSMECFEEKDGKYINTVTAIKDLVEKMKEDGTFDAAGDPSVDSDDEDQYEAPQLPDYFCCMLCFQGSRCTVVEPCRHVFGCVQCVEELMDTYKICVLCANKITEYEMLENEDTKDDSFKTY